MLVIPSKHTHTHWLYEKRIILEKHPPWCFPLSLPPCSVGEWYPSVSCQCQRVIQRAVTSHQPALVRPFAAASPDSGPKKMCTGWGEDREKKRDGEASQGAGKQVKWRQLKRSCRGDRRQDWTNYKQHRYAISGPISLCWWSSVTAATTQSDVSVILRLKCLNFGHDVPEKEYKLSPNLAIVAQVSIFSVKISIFVLLFHATNLHPWNANKMLTCNQIICCICPICLHKMLICGHKMLIADEILICVQNAGKMLILLPTKYKSICTKC